MRRSFAPAGFSSVLAALLAVVSVPTLAQDSSTPEAVNVAKAYFKAIADPDLDKAQAVVLPLSQTYDPAAFRKVAANPPLISDHARVVDYKMDFDGAAVVYDNGPGTAVQTLYLLARDGKWFVLLGKPSEVKEIHDLQADDLAAFATLEQWAHDRK